MTCPHDNISLPTTSDPDIVCADCGAVLNLDEISDSTVDTNGNGRYSSHGQRKVRRLTDKQSKGLRR